MENNSTFTKITKKEFNSLQTSSREKKLSPLTIRLEGLKIGEALIIHKDGYNGKRPQYYALSKATGKKFTSKACKDNNYYAVLRKS